MASTRQRAAAEGVLSEPRPGFALKFERTEPKAEGRGLVVSLCARRGTRAVTAA